VLGLVKLPVEVR